MSKTRWLIIIALLVGFIIYSKLWNVEGMKGNLAPDFTAELIDGTTFKLSQLRGQYVLLDFWGSWCPPCRKDNPNLVSLYQQFYGQSFVDGDGFEIVTIALEKDNKRWQKAAAKDGFLWKYQIVKLSKIVLAAPLAIKYGVSSVPTKLLISPNGEIIGVNMTKEEISSYLTTKRQL